MSSKALMPVQHISISIARPPDQVYAYAANAANLPHWAKGLASAPAEVKGQELLLESPLGDVTVRFVSRNDLGVLDHDVTLASGETTHNPMRVLRNGDGSELVFSVFRRPDVDDAAFRSDCEAVTRDLQSLKQQIEASPAG